MREDLKLLLGLIKDFFKRKRLIYAFLGVFGILGFISAFFTPKVYNSNTSFITQVSEDKGLGSGLKNIASLIGVNIGGNKDQKDIPVYLYPKLMSSLSYNRQLLDTKVLLKNKNSISLREYYLTHKRKSLIEKIKKYTVGLPGLVISKFSRKEHAQVNNRIDSLSYISKEEVILLNNLSEDMIFTIDEFDGSIEIRATMQDPTIAAQAAESAKILLQDKIIEYRLGKAQERYNFINTQYELKKQEYLEAQNKLAYHIDRNRFNNTEASLLRRKKLENEVNLAYVVYSELESKRISEQINLKEDTPVFTTIQNAIVPIKPINSNALLEIIKFVLIGFIVSVFVHVFLIMKTKFLNIWRDI